MIDATIAQLAGAPQIAGHRTTVARDRDDGEADIREMSVAGFKGKLGTSLHPFFRLQGRGEKRQSWGGWAGRGARRQSPEFLFSGSVALVIDCDIT